MPGGKPATPAAPGPAEPPPGDMATLVRDELAKVQEAERVKAAADGDAAWRAGVDAKIKAIPETRPAEPRTGFKARLQDVMFGKPS